MSKRLETAVGTLFPYNMPLKPHWHFYLVKEKSLGHCFQIQSHVPLGGTEEETFCSFV